MRLSQAAAQNPYRTFGVIGNLALRGLLVPLALAACASSSTGRSGDLRPESQTDLRSILTQPFNDLNLVRTEIPDELKRVQQAPYQRGSPFTCSSIAAEISTLDQILGPDIQSGNSASDDPIISREAAERAARDAARSAASGWIPFRGLVRQVSGAERHARALKEAVLAGNVRRAYLKGLLESAPC